MTLTPDYFRADLTKGDLTKLRWEAHLERVRDACLLECRVRRMADPALRRGDVVWVEDSQNRVRGRYVVLAASSRQGHTVYRLAANGQRPPTRGEVLLPLRIS
jgi:hypothetical protein